MNSHFNIDLTDQQGTRQVDPDSLVANWLLKGSRAAGEIVLPYQAPQPTDATLFNIWRLSKNKWWLFAFGGGWLATSGISYLGLATLGCRLYDWTEALMPLKLSKIMSEPKVGCFWGGLYSILFIVCSCALAITVFAIGTILLYFFLVFIGLRLSYGKHWLRTIMGPTEVGVSSCGIKIAWKTRLLSLYGPMVSWRDVTRLQCIQSDLGDTSNTELVFRFSRNGAEANFVIDPNGFSTDTERSIFLKALEQCLPRSVIDPGALSIISGSHSGESALNNPQQIDEWDQELHSALESEDFDLNERIAAIEDKQTSQGEPLQHSIKLKESSEQVSTKLNC